MTMSDNSTPHSAQVYDIQVRKTIPYYDEFHTQTIKIVKAIGINPKTWLDTGCGTGSLAQKATTEFPATHFVLVDPSPQMLEAAKEKLANQGPTEIEFLQPCSTEKLEKHNEEFDVITAIQSHHYLIPSDRIKATRVCFELLSSKGVYVTFENIRPLTAEGIRIGKENWGQFQLSNGRSRETVDEHLSRFDIEYHPITIKEHLSLLRRTGFSTVELLWYSCMQAGFYCLK
jgi:tRNA (cmo5U34)-methyltransferase